MKYQNLRSFRKHLSSAAPENLCKCYLAAVPDDYERRIAIQSVLLHFSGNSIARFHGESCSVRDISEALLSPSLFGGESVVVLEEAEKMDKKDLQTLACWVHEGRICGFLICGVRSKTALSAAFEKTGVVFDLIDEKPWDKEKRLIDQIVQRVADMGKRLATDAAPLILERIGPEPALLDSEIDKLVCFVGDRATIERSDVFRISIPCRTQTHWQMAEEIIWEGRWLPDDTSSFHALLPALRSQLQMGLKIADLQALQKPKDEWLPYFPRLRPKVLEKRTFQALGLGRMFFKNALDLLFEIELLSRTGSGHENAYMDFFRITLHARR